MAADAPSEPTPTAPLQPRRALRFQMRVPVIFCWSDEQGQAKQGGGFTRDISTAGVFVYSAAPPPVGTSVEIDVLLPIRAGGGPGARLHSPGRVVRVESRGEHGGFAAASDFGMDNPVI